MLQFISDIWNDAATVVIISFVIWTVRRSIVERDSRKKQHEDTSKKLEEIDRKSSENVSRIFEILKNQTSFQNSLDEFNGTQMETIRYIVNDIHARFMPTGKIDKFSYDMLIKLQDDYSGTRGINGLIDKIVADIKTLQIEE